MPIRTETVRFADNIPSAVGDPLPPPQIEQLNNFAGDLNQRAAMILSSLRDMRTAAFGPHPEAVGADKTPKPAGAVDLLHFQLHDISDTLTACESVLREVRRII